MSIVSGLHRAIKGSAVGKQSRYPRKMLTTAIFETLEQRAYLSFSVTAVASDTQTALSWTSDPSAVSYNAYESTDEGSSWTKINTSPLTGTSFTATGLSNGRTYDFSVTTVDASNNESDPGDNDEEVIPQPPVVSVSGATSVVAGHAYTLNLNVSQSSSPADAGAIDHWTVDWGDGTSGDPDTQTVSGSASSVTHTYDDSGPVEISATATDQVGTLAAPKTQLDTSYGSGGTTLLNYYSAAQSATLQSDGKLLIAINSVDEFNPGAFSIARLNADGSADSSFGSGGEISDTVLSTGIYDATWISDLKELGSGKLIAVATGDSGTYLIRYNSNGTTDTSFGTEGKVAASSSVGGPNSLAVQSDGKIIEAGSDGLARYNADGSLDSSFGSSGVVTISGGVSTVIPLSGGKLLVLGSTLQRYDSDGTLDTSFASSGSVPRPSGYSYYGIATQSDGKIVLGASDGSDNYILRFDSDGSTDTSFGASGAATLPSGNSALSIAVQADDNILYGGGGTVGRLNSDGSTDATFGTAGTSSPVFNSYQATGVSTVIALPSGKDLILGQATYWSEDGTTFNSQVAAQQVLPSNAVVVTEPPDVSISGDTQITQGSTYNLHLNSEFPTVDSGFETIDSWSINWGDGDTQTITGNPESATHTYTGLGTFNISAAVSYDGSTTTANAWGVSSTTPDSVWTDSATQVGSTALQSDGKLVTVAVDGSNFVVKRYDASGLDPTFGTDGVVTTDVTEADSATIFVQSNGDIVVAGQNGSGAVMVRYLPDGALDTSFGSSGISVISDGAMSNVGQFAQLPDGQLILDANDNYGTDTFDVLLINTDGSVVGGLGGGDGDDFRPVSVPYIRTDGSFLVLGSGDAGGFVQLYNSDGTTGMVVPVINMTSTIDDVAAQNDGKIIVEGTDANGLLIDRYNTDGSFDGSFNYDGGLSGNPAAAGPIAIEPDDKIVIATSNSSGDVVLSRFNSDGSRDAIFGTDGQIVTDLTGSPDQVAIAPDGGITVSIQGDGSVTVATYNDQASSSVPVTVYRPFDLSESTIIGDGTTFPDLPYTTPSSDPTLPSGMNTFAPPVDSESVASGAPVIATFNTDAEPNQTIALTGSDFTTLAGNATIADTQFLVYGQTGSSNGTKSFAQIQDETANAAMITLDSGQPANSMYFIWAVNPDGVSAPVAINQTQAWWIGTQGEIVDNSTTPSTIEGFSGGTMSVFGKNLSNGASTPQSWVYLQPTGGGSGTWSTVTSVNPYKVDFNLPTVSSTTTYNVWVNNGLGGNYGWSEVKYNGSPVVLSVKPSAPTWSTDTSNWFDVTSYGADNTGATDSGSAIQSAINALESAQRAASNPAYTYTLYFPAGTYVDSGKEMQLPSNVRVMGAGADETTLDFQGAIDYSYYGSGWGYLNWGNGTTGIQLSSMTINHTGSQFSVPGDYNSFNALMGAGNGNNITLNDLKIVSNIGISLNGSSNVTVENSTITADLIFIWGHDIFLNNDNLLLAFEQEEAAALGGSYNVSITDSYIGNLDDSITDSWDGAGQSRFLEYNTDFGNIYNQYIAGNTTLLGQPYAGNSGEQILSEGGGSVFFSGSLASATASTFTVTVPHSEDPLGTLFGAGNSLIVTDGVGVTQLETVASIVDTYNSTTSTNTIVATLTHNWTVQPNSSSHITIGNFLSDAVFYQNTLQDEIGTRGIGNAHASTGIDVGGYQLIADDNTLKDLGSGVAMRGSAGIHSPTFFEEAINNTISLSSSDTGPYYGVPEGVGLGASVSEDTTDTNFVGVVVRNNTISGIPLGIDLAWQGLGSDAFTIIENNSVEAQTGISIFDDPDTLVRNNAFTAPSGSSTTPVAVAFNGYPALLRGNSYTGYSSGDVYTGDLPDLMLTDENDVLSASVGAGGSTTLSLPLWDNSPVTTTWTGTTSSTWLSLGSSTGTIANEEGSTSATLSIDASSLTAGTYLATVYVVLANSTIPKIFAVWLTVT